MSFYKSRIPPVLWSMWNVRFCDPSALVISPSQENLSALDLNAKVVNRHPITCIYLVAITMFCMTVCVVCVCVRCRAAYPSGHGIGLLIKRLQVRSLLKTLWCCCFLEQETLLTLLQSTQLLNGYTWGSSPPSCNINGYLA